MASRIPLAQPPPEEHSRVLLWRWRRNPLRRRTDLLQAWIALSLFLATLAATPAATVLAKETAHRHYQQAARHQAGTRHATPAVLVDDAPRHPEPGSDEAKHALYPVTVRFTDPRGHTRTAESDVRPGLPADSAIRVWVSDEGKITDPPLTPQQIHSRTMGCALLAAMTVPLAGAALYGYASRRLERRNLAAWDKDWIHTAPLWTSST
ncbi:hypothetical protein [Streptomyces sp. NPDC008141]|uniref:Rv1733c family protein n=1 Tax=Streptomyces sp. NPDC008141 TaxID=3364815 RepID=UPI0036EBE387